jgi:hypothetical protein
MSAFPVLSPLCPIEGDTNALVATDTLYPPVKETPMTPGELEAKVHRVQQESRSIIPPNIPRANMEPIPVDRMQPEMFEQELQRMQNDMMAPPDIHIPKIHVIQDGDELVASVSFSGNVVLHTKAGNRVFTGIFASEEPFRHAVETERTKKGIQHYTVNGVSFSVDYTNYQ